MSNRRRRRGRKSMRSQVFKNKRDLKRINDSIEYKFFDLAKVTVVCDSTVTTGITLLNPVPGGTAGVLLQERDGNEVHATRIKVRCVFENDNGTPADGIARILLVRKIDTDRTTAPTTEVILNQTDATATTTSFRAMSFKENYKVYWDHTFTYDTTQHSLIPFIINQKLDHQTIWTSATGTIGALQQNGIFLICLSTAAAGANAPSLSIDSRFSFTDL